MALRGSRPAAGTGAGFDVVAQEELLAVGGVAASRLGQGGSQLLRVLQITGQGVLVCGPGWCGTVVVPEVLEAEGQGSR